MHLYTSQKVKQRGRCYKFQQLDSSAPHITMVEVGERLGITQCKKPRLTHLYFPIHARYIIGPQRLVDLNSGAMQT